MGMLNNKTETVIEQLNEALGHRGMHLVNGRKAKKAWKALPVEKRTEYLAILSDRERKLVGV